MMKLGFLFAGQGSQHAGMGAVLYEAYPAFRAVLDSAEVDFDIKEVSFTDSQGVINQTRYTQPCMVAFAAGLTTVLAQQGIRPAVAAGLSLGEYSALHAAGVFDAETAIELVAFRGKAMAEAVTGRPCGMAAVLHLEREKLQAACDAASALGVAEIANYNCPGQLVIAGDAAAVDAAAAVRTARVRQSAKDIHDKYIDPPHTTEFGILFVPFEGLYAELVNRGIREFRIVFRHEARYGEELGLQLFHDREEDCWYVTGHRADGPCFEAQVMLNDTEQSEDSVR